jgi:PqqD family protein of HPr-rel-A system
MATFRRSVDVQSTPVGERIVLFHRGTGKSIVLNPAAAMLWAALGEPATVADLAERLCRHHAGLSPERAAEDAARCIEQLAAESLVISDA